MAGITDIEGLANDKSLQQFKFLNHTYTVTLITLGMLRTGRIKFTLPIRTMHSKYLSTIQM